MSRSTSSVLRTVSIAVCIVLSTVMAHAQYRASIQGVVTDAQGAVVPGATLTLTDKDNNHRLTAATNDGGIYNFSALPPDHYSLTVEKTGFKKKVLDNLGVIAEQANAINVELEVGAGNETVTVSGTEVPLIDTETAQVSGTVTSQEIQKLPSFGRDVFNFCNWRRAFLVMARSSRAAARTRCRARTTADRARPAVPSRRRTSRRWWLMAAG